MPIINININNLPHRYFTSGIMHPTTDIKVSYCTDDIKPVLDGWTGPTDDVFILCPIYYNRESNTHDIQIGVTGKAKFGEQMSTAISRELGEEIGFVVKARRSVNSASGSARVRVTDLEPVTSSIKRKFPYLKTKDDYSRRLAVAAWGTRTETSMLISSMDVTGRRLYDGEKDIVGVVAVPFRMAKQSVDTLQRRAMTINIPAASPRGGIYPSPTTSSGGSWRESPLNTPTRSFRTTSYPTTTDDGSGSWR